MTPELDASWKPERCGFVLNNGNRANQFVVDVDPAKPDSWRREPYYSTIKHWARSAHPHGRQVVVQIGRRVICMFPGEEIDAGIVARGEVVTMTLDVRGEFDRVIVQIRSAEENTKILRGVAGRWRPKAALPV